MNYLPWICAVLVGLVFYYRSEMWHWRRQYQWKASECRELKTKLTQVKRLETPLRPREKGWAVDHERFNSLTLPPLDPTVPLSPQEKTAGEDPMKRATPRPADLCAGRHTHTVCPSEYHQWHAWAEKKMRTHRQVRCPTCGLWTIWKKKTVSRIPGQEPPPAPRA